MGHRPITQLIKRCLRAVGLELRRVTPAESFVIDRSSLPEMLEHIRRLGLVPKTVVDVGAAYGSFTRTCSAVFPDAQFLMVEPLIEYQGALKEVARSIPGSRYIAAAAAARAGEITINVHQDLVGSSLLQEVEQGSGVNGVPRHVRSVTVDQLVHAEHASGPYLLKIDVQGAELEVLRGAEILLKEAEYVLLEVSLFQFFEGGPQFSDVVNYMTQRGFAVYDISGLQYRPLDQALSQADIAFVKEDGLFRRHHCYATPAQRAEQNARMKKHLSELVGERTYDS